jgi:cell division protein FtsW
MFKSFLKGIDTTFLIIVMGIVVFGLIMLTSASGPMGFERFGNSYYFLRHQFLAGVVPGVILMFITMRIPYERYRKYALPMLLLSIVLLSLVFIPGIGEDFGTFAKSWVVIGPLSFQPAEIVKLTFLLYLAAWMDRHQKELKTFYSGLVPFLFVLGIISIMMIFQPDIGTLSVIAAMAFIVYFIAGGPVAYLGGIGMLGIVSLGILVKASPYRAARFMTFLHPELDPLGVGYQINQALLAIGSGGLFGRGYGHSLQKFQYLPEVIGDSIFAVISEELGFFLVVGFLIAYVAMILRGFSIAQNTKDNFGKFLVVGIIVWFGVQALLNVGSMVGLFPITGVPLPFLSFGGTSLAISLAAVGIVLNVSKSTSMQ